jgi:hypothetical protein
LPGEDLAQPFVVGVVVRQLMYRLACSLWLGWTGGVEREVAQRRELDSGMRFNQHAVPCDKEWA